MQRLIKTLILLLILFSSCTRYHKKELTEKEKEKMQLQSAESDLNYDKEKLVLLATIKQLPYDTLFSILRDYYFKTDFRSNATFEQAINYTTERHSLSKRKIADIIFNFKYEMMTRDDIIDEEVQDSQNDSY